MNVRRCERFHHLGKRGVVLAILLLSCNKERSETHAAASTPSPSGVAPTAAAPAAAEPASAAPAAAPSLPVRSLILDPSFVAKSGPFAAGTAFPLRWSGAPGGVVVLSCHHIFGPMGGLAADVEPSALPGFIQKASVTDRDGKSYTLGPALAVPHAKTFNVMVRDAGNDVSVFQAPAELAPHALELATALPKKDERVWLLARVQGQAELIWPAAAFFVSDSFLVYQFDSTALDLRATSGAPVVNAQGQLVAINLGGNPYQGVVRGFGTPVTGVRRALEAAAPAKN